MKTLKKSAAVLLLIAALCNALVFYPAAADTDVDTVFWSVWNGSEQVLTPFTVKGELKTGKNDVMVNDGCLSLHAECSGYYAIDITSPSEKGVLFEVATIDSKNKANNVFSTYGCCMWIDDVDDGKGFNGIIFYIEQPGTYYIRFSYEEYIDGKYVTEDIFACSADVRFLGNLISVSAGKNPLYIGTDISLVWPYEDYHTVGFGCTFVFSDGITYPGGNIGVVDKLAPGKRTLSFELSNGPEIEMQVNLASLIDSVEEVVLPDDFTPARIYRFDPDDYQGYSSNFSRPGYLELHFKDGTAKKVALDSTETGTECWKSFRYGGKDHSVYSYIHYPGDGEVFSISVDDIVVYEKELKRVSSGVSDLMTFLLEVSELLKSVHTGSPDNTAKNISAVSCEIYNLTKAYIQYLRFIAENDIAII